MVKDNIYWSKMVVKYVENGYTFEKALKIIKQKRDEHNKKLLANRGTKI